MKGPILLLITAILWGMAFVALIGLLAGKKPHLLVCAAAGVALVGMWLLCVPDGFDWLHVGDSHPVRGRLLRCHRIYVPDHRVADDRSDSGFDSHEPGVGVRRIRRLARAFRGALPVEFVGCALVFATVILAQVPDFIENARRKRGLAD